MSRPEAVMIAPDWPGPDGGLNIAIRAELAAYSAYFRRVHLLVFSGDKPGDHRVVDYPQVNWRYVWIPRRSPWIRFIRSLFQRHPAITLQYRVAGPAARAALEKIRLQTDQTTPPVIIFVTQPPGVLIPLARKIFPGSRIVVHSHNVISRAFSGFARSGKLLSRAVWSYELARIRRFEHWLDSATDCFWTISESDREEYQSGSRIKVDGVLGVYLDIDRYAGLPPGDPETIVHIGRIDLRKGRGMHWFIQRVWPLIREHRSTAELLLAGKGTERFTDPSSGIKGCGYVKDERDILRRGMIFINPQIDGSGIQLKSIVAMLSGRLLVTTVTGGKGIAGASPTHFLAEDNPERYARNIIESMDNPLAAQELAARGQARARQAYGRDNYLSRADELFVRTLG